MEWISNWAEQIIVAVMIGTIIEMVLPSGNNKKYIKTIVGIYVLFTIIAPVIGKITNQDFGDLNFNYEQYLEKSDTYQTMSKNLESKKEASIEQIYQGKLKEDIQSKLKEKGYLASNIIVESVQEGQTDYGKITKIEIEVTKKEEIEEKEEIKNSISIEKVNTVTIGNQITQLPPGEQEKNILTSQEEKEVRNYLASVYEVAKKNIKINGKGG